MVLTAMFPAVCHKFVQAMGPDTLQAVKSMDRAHEVKPLNVVVKKTKRRFIFFKKASYRPYDFELQDLLQNPEEAINASIHTSQFCEFNPTSKYSLSGKIGLQILQEAMDAKLSASDSIVISSPLGVILKREVESDEMLVALSKRKLDLGHVFLRQVCQNPKEVLCVVKGVCQVQKDAEIKRVDTIDGEMDIDEKKATAFISGGVDSKGHMEKDQDIVVPAGTPIAYTVLELKVNTANGEIEPQFVRGCHGGFVTSVPPEHMDVADAPQTVKDAEKITFTEEDVQRMKDILSPLRTLEKGKRDKLRTLLLEVTCHHDDVEILADLMEKIEDGEEVSRSSMKMSCLKTKDEVCQELLGMIGFRVEKDNFTFEGKVTPLFTAMGYVFDALDELKGPEMELLGDCLKSCHDVKLLLQLCEDNLQGCPPKKLPHTVEQSSSMHKLASHLGFTIHGTEVSSPKELSAIVDEVFCVLYAFAELGN